MKAINLKSQGLDTLERICNPQKICFYLTEFILKLILELEITTKWSQWSLLNFYRAEIENIGKNGCR